MVVLCRFAPFLHNFTTCQEESGHFKTGCYGFVTKPKAPQSRCFIFLTLFFPATQLLADDKAADDTKGKQCLFWKIYHLNLNRGCILPQKRTRKSFSSIALEERRLQCSKNSFISIFLTWIYISQMSQTYTTPTCSVEIGLMQISENAKSRQQSVFITKAKIM